MRCIFCKEDSSSSKSVEHVIPESIGNKSIILGVGIVCDKCNNYFSRKVESPFLNSEPIKSLRSYQLIGNKRGRIPPSKGFVVGGGTVDIYRRIDTRETAISVDPKTFQHLLSADEGMLLVPIGGAPSAGPVISRFLAKVAVEYMAFRLQGNAQLLEEFTNDGQLDPIRSHARLGKPNDWPVHFRRIYPPDAGVLNSHGEKIQTVYEEDLFSTNKNEIYFVMALFGEEFVINIGGPDIDGYLEWLKENDSKSPLYTGKNSKNTMPD